MVRGEALGVRLNAPFNPRIVQVVTLAMARGQPSRYRAMSAAGFGRDLIFLGSMVMRESVVPLATYPWF